MPKIFSLLIYAMKEVKPKRCKPVFLVHGYLKESQTNRHVMTEDNCSIWQSKGYEIIYEAISFISFAYKSR